MSIPKDPEQLAQDLRTIADRLEDGEYVVTQMELYRPSSDGENPGHFQIEYETEEEFQRMAKVYQEQMGDVYE